MEDKEELFKYLNLAEKEFTKFDLEDIRKREEEARIAMNIDKRNKKIDEILEGNG